MLSLLVVLSIVAGGMAACGGSKKATVPGTTAGNYIVTVTGTSGSITETGTATLTVQ